MIYGGYVVMNAMTAPSIKKSCGCLRRIRMDTIPIGILLFVLISVVWQINKKLEIITAELQTITFHFK